MTRQDSSLKSGSIAPGLAPQQQLERAVGRLELVAAVLELLDPLEHAPGCHLVQLDADRGRLLAHAGAARELRDQQLALVADQRRRDVLERRGVRAHAGDMHAALVGEGVAPDVGLIGIRRDVEELVDEVGGLGQPRELLVGEAAKAELELEVGDDRNEVGVAGPFAAAVDRALNLASLRPRPRRACSRRRIRRRCGSGCRRGRLRRAPRSRRPSRRRSATAATTRWCRTG